MNWFRPLEEKRSQISTSHHRQISHLHLNVKTAINCRDSDGRKRNWDLSTLYDDFCLIRRWVYGGSWRAETDFYYFHNQLSSPEPAHLHLAHIFKAIMFRSNRDTRPSNVVFNCADYERECLMGKLLFPAAISPGIFLINILKTNKKHARDHLSNCWLIAWWAEKRND